MIYFQGLCLIAEQLGDASARGESRVVALAALSRPCVLQSLHRAYAHAVTSSLGAIAAY